MPGFEAKFKHPLLKRHECPICLFAMRHPVQTECGHLFCRDCLEPVLKRRHPVCPLDKEEITQEGTFPDNACRREILKLQVFCNFQNCPWIGALKDLEAHLGNCDYRDVQCTQCGQYIQQLDMEAHQKELCAMRPTTCPHCSKDVPTQQLQLDMSATDKGQLTIYTLMRHTKLTNEQVNQVIAEKDLSKIADLFDSTDDLCEQFGLSNSQKADVERLQQRSTKKSAKKALKSWRNRYPYKATFKNLLIILLDSEKGVVAKDVANYISNRSQQER